MYVLRSSVLNIDWNIFLMYYMNNYLFLFYIVVCNYILDAVCAPDVKG